MVNNGKCRLKIVKFVCKKTGICKQVNLTLRWRNSFMYK